MVDVNLDIKSEYIDPKHERIPLSDDLWHHWNEHGVTVRKNHGVVYLNEEDLTKIFDEWVEVAVAGNTGGTLANYVLQGKVI